MSSVMFISETGFAHSAVLVHGSKWYGFKPSIPKFLFATGHLDHSDRTQFIKHKVTFHFESSHHVHAALVKVLAAYQTAWYLGGIRDCVTFTADFAEDLGLRIPPRPNFIPDHFLLSLARLNGGHVHKPSKGHLHHHPH
jgi:hypothetical protein